MRAALVSQGSRLPSRMELLVDPAEVVSVDVGIDLGGREIDVTQHLLDGPEVRAPLQQMERYLIYQNVR